MGLVSKVTKAIDDPGGLEFFFRSRLNELLLLARRGRYGAIASYVLSGIVGRSVYSLYLGWLASERETPFIRRDVRDFELVLDMTDPGISKELILFGTREDKLATVFEAEVESACDEAIDPIIVDIGANIGYFSVMMANAAPNAEIVAIEPVERNVELLRENIEHNDVDDRISIHQCAIGPESGTGELRLSERSNVHRITASDGVVDDHARTIEVPMESLDRFLDDRDVPPENVTVVRMDLEGYELSVLEGMSTVLCGQGPTVIYLEVHPRVLGRIGVRRIGTILKDHGFEVVAVESGTITWEPFDFTFDVDTFDGLETIERAYGLIVRK